jgi:indolepyruvate ferredoxin oxidoreductase beta subunit
MSNKVKNILLVGVGGQGTILVSKILSSGLLNAGYDVKMSEIHGMAQRGGSVSTQVRFGEKVHSPIMAHGQADILVSFEMMEALRWMKYLSPEGKVVINDYQIPSAPILFGKVDYPEGVAQIISKKVNATIIKASEIAAKIGNARTMNIVLFGALVKSMKLTEIDWESAIRDNVKSNMVDINIAAFKAGMETVN